MSDPRSCAVPCCAVWCCAVFLILKQIFLGHAPVALLSGDAVVQKIALKQVQRALKLRPAFGEAVVQELVASGVITALAGVVKPGTDARESLGICVGDW